ncbi:hypothetical protein DN730_08150 [Marinomonas piezotolerans]|uniref:Uncharacterized protein n=1 Tax=Marinomonas piezotolerans TaxID=2213058 RepID=A0A370U998_9GAMM|nr:hypothetical protein [Marinomonas piezotolerans]RDL44366.1 hypothetical protein DN730_08150 [Marinomonas piezotolerans]
MTNENDTDTSSGELSCAQIHELLAQQVNDKIEEFEAFALEQEQIELPVEHLFVNGMYARKILIPKGTVLTGAVHKWGYVDIMLSGDISVATPEGVKRMTGWQILEGKAGRKRMGYAHEDTHWITVHRTDATTSDGIESILTVQNMAQFEALPLTEREVILKEETQLCQLPSQQ